MVVRDSMAGPGRAGRRNAAAQIGGRAYFVGGALTCGGGASADTLELSLTG